MFLGYRTISRRVCILMYHLILFRVIEAKSRCVMASKKMELNGKIITHWSVATVLHSKRVDFFLELHAD